MLPWLSRRSRITRLAAGSITPSASPMAANRSSPRPSPLASQRHLLAEVGGGMPAIAAMLVLVLALVPRSSSPIGLRWISGSSDLTFSSALRCTLVVAAESGEQRLPPTWRLTWVAQGCSIEPVAIDPVSACLGDLAQVTAVLPPATPADSAAHTTTALLCSAPTSNASSAFFLLDLPAGSSGKLKAAALDTTGLTPHVVESSEVRFNGGLPDPYPPGLLEAGRTHPSTQLLVQAVGTDLTRSEP